MIMIERIARALAKQSGIPYDENSQSVRNMLLNQAKAVLREMLVGMPLEVKLAGASAITAEHMRAMANYDAFCDAYQAAIQAAIDEGEG